MVPMILEDMQFDGADSGAISWGDEVSDEAKAASPVVVIGCGQSGILAGIRLTQAGLPFTIVEKDDGPGGTWWENRYPGRASTSGATTTATRSSPRTTGASTSASSRSCAPTSSACSTSTSCSRTAASAPRSPALTWDEPSSSWRVGVRNPDGTTEDLDARFVISAVGSLNIPQAARHPRHGVVRRAVVPLRPLARRTRHHRHAVRARRRRRHRLPDRADDRRPGRAAHDLPAHHAVDAAEPAVPHVGAAGRPMGDAAPAVLRALVPLPHDLSRHRHGDRAVPGRSRLPRHGRASRSTRRTSCGAGS